MPVTCPSCEASYRLDESALGSGRRLRCSRCKAEWFAEGPARRIESLDDAVPIDAIDEIEALAASDAPAEAQTAGATGRRAPAPRRLAGRRRFALPRPPRPRATALVAAVGLGLLVVGVGARADVVRAAPSLASLYSAVGLPVNVRGLDILEVRSVETVEEGVPILLVTGRIENVSGDERDVPRLKIAVRAGDGRELYGWTAVVSRPKLSPRESAPFRARLASPPAEGREIAVRFLTRQDLAARPAR